jgi:hypothetical protein
MGQIKLYGTTSSGLPNLKYHWSASNGGVIISSLATTRNYIVVNSAGDYHLIVEDGSVPSQMSAKETFTVTENLATPDLTITHTPVTTALNSTAELSVGVTAIELAGTSTAGDTFVWTKDNVFLSTNPTIVVTDVATYKLTTTDTANACTRTKSVVVTDVVVEPPVAIIQLYDDSGTVTGSHLDCFQDSQNIVLNGETSTGSGPFTYLWSPGGEITPEITVTTSGTYGLIVTDINSTPSLETFVTITENLVSPTSIITASPSNTLSFENPAIQLDGSTSTDHLGVPAYPSPGGDITFQWSTGANTPIIEVSAANTYTLTVTDGVNGCANASVFEVFANPVTGISVGIDSVGTVLSCSATTITQTISVTNPNSDLLTYQWSKTGFGDLVGETSDSLIINVDGEYTVTVYNTVTTQTTTASITITGDANTNLSSAVITGSATISCTGTTLLDGSTSTTDGAISYEWTDAEGGGNILGTSSTYLATIADTYYLRVYTTGYPLCSRSDKHTVSETASPTVIIIAPTETIPDGGTVTLSANIAGGTGPYIYLWSPGGAETPTIDVTTAGDYTLVVKDSNGCPATDNQIMVDEVTADTEPPSNVGYFLAEQIYGAETVGFMFDEATDNSGISHYEIWRKDNINYTWELLYTTPTNFDNIDTTVNYGTIYTYKVYAVDNNGNISAQPSNESVADVQDFGFCLVEGTQILTSEGDWTCIEDLIDSDELMSANLDDFYFNIDKPLEWKSPLIDEIRSSSKITTIYSFETYNTIIINKGLLEATQSHIQLINRDDVWQFSEMSDVKEGDKLYNIERELIEVIDIEVNTDKRVAYKLTLEAPNHMYFANKILTHN